MSVDLPLIVEPELLKARLGAEDLIVVDLGQAGRYAEYHIPGAVHVEYGSIVLGRPPVGGLLPDAAQLGALFSRIGLTPESWVVAYDDEGGGRAGRLLWTLDVLGHSRVSLLNGGIHTWANESHALESRPVTPAESRYTAVIGAAHHVDARYIMEHLGDDRLALLDTRSPEEFSGLKRVSLRGGHIPGAVNMDWVLAMDQSRNLRLKTEPELRRLLEERGVTPEKEVIVYCQTHHRSSHTYVVLKSLGYPRISGYPGAWSEWGNLPDTPIEC